MDGVASTTKLLATGGRLRVAEGPDHSPKTPHSDDMISEGPTDPRMARSGRGGGLGPAWRLGPATVVLIGISVVVALLSKLDDRAPVLDWLFISNSFNDASGMPLPEIAHGEVWRLLTPIFIHFGAAHLIFNMVALKDLGTVIEIVAGTRRLLALVVVIAVLSNLGQFYMSGPVFGGMSGVVYGLFGYVWMRSKFDPAPRFILHSQTVIMMIGWFILCLAKVIPNVANSAHAVGLAIGVVWGFLSAKSRTARR